MQVDSRRPRQRVLPLLLFSRSLWFASCLDNGVGRTPPMGWLSWERFGCQTNCELFPDTCISEHLYLTQAQLMVDWGFRDAGYVYVNIDDCWAEMERDSTTGKLVADRKRFPRGIQYLSNTFHSMGLKLGLYGDIGKATCEGYPGFEGNFRLDAETLAEWGVDSIKVDACHADESLFNITYPQFGRALNATGRPILYSCSWPNDYYERRHHWEDPDYLNHGIKQTCNIWRNYFDIHDSWESVSKTINFWARNSSIDVMVRAAGPGHFNDPDMVSSISNIESCNATLLHFFLPMLTCGNLFFAK
jgi:Alpha galactosidase A